MNPNPARKRTEFFRQEAGSKSEAILTHNICNTKRIFDILYFLVYWICSQLLLVNQQE